MTDHNITMRLHLTALALALALASPAGAHEWYTNQVNAKGENCCGGNDCAGGPWAFRQTPTGYDVDIPVGAHPKVTSLNFAPGTVITFHFTGNPGLSPDGDVHACLLDYQIPLRTLRCLFIGGLM